MRGTVKLVQRSSATYSTLLKVFILVFVLAIANCRSKPKESSPPPQPKPAAEISSTTAPSTPPSPTPNTPTENQVAPSQIAGQTTNRPNILVIWGDDIGYWNISAYNRGMMNYRTPNIDRIASEGALFTNYYGQQSCTAGRAAFITGQSPIRTGLTKVGLPGAKLGLQKEDPTLAEMLKPLGYMTAQYGKNHLGDLDEYLPTAHGFDEFFGNLYHLNAEEEPENIDYPKNPEFKKRYGPRGVIKSTAGGEIIDTGPLTKKRMETIDEEITQGALDFIDRAHQAGKPFFLWWNSTRMHIWTHLKPESQGKSGIGIYPDGMVEHDGHVGQLLKKLDDLKIADNTIVFYSTDNGAEVMSWPDGGTTPFRGEKNTNWEGGYRVPAMVRWPGVVKPGSEITSIMAHEDWIPTLMAYLGEPDLNNKLKSGYAFGNTSYRVHLDGYNQLDLLSGKGSGQRREFLYWTDDGDLAALRFDRWKIVFMEQRAHGFDVWQEPFVTLRLPKLFDLYQDPFERADHDGMGYGYWRINRAFVLVPAQDIVGKWLGSFKEFPPRQRPSSFGIDQAMEALMPATN